MLNLDPDDLQSDPLAFEEHGDLIVPWPVTEKIARRTAELNPDPILRQIQKEEADQRRKMTHGKWEKPTRRT